MYTPVATLPAGIANAATTYVQDDAKVGRRLSQPKEDFASDTAIDQSNADAAPLAVLQSDHATTLAPAEAHVSVQSPALAPTQVPVPVPRQALRPAQPQVHVPAHATSPNLGAMQIYFHGAISRGEAEETLRATGANFRYLFRAKNSTSIVLSVRYTAGGKHKVQHSMLSQAMSAQAGSNSTTVTYLLDGKAFNNIEAGASFADALKALVSVMVGRIGKQLYPVRDPTQADAANGGGSNAVGSYQNTSWESMMAFVSELPQMDRTDAEALLADKGIDGGFVLRVKTAQNIVVSCMVSPGKFQHHAVSLAETLGGQRAAWVHRGIEVEEQSLIEAARGILRDVHVMNTTWIGGGSGVFSSEA